MMTHLLTQKWQTGKQSITNNFQDLLINSDFATIHTLKLKYFSINRFICFFADPERYLGFDKKGQVKTGDKATLINQVWL